MASQTPAAASMSAPTITSPRLIMRPPVPSDGEAMASFFTNPANFPWDVEADLTLEKALARIDLWTRATAEGKSAFKIIAEREGGQMVGFGGFNCLPYTEPLGSGDRPTWEIMQKEKEQGPGDGGSGAVAEVVLAADMGMSIDHRYQRRGYGREAVCAQVEYAFGVLGAGWVHMDTGKGNVPFRGLMRDMGVPEVEGDGGEETPEGCPFVYARKSFNYQFDGATWDRVRGEMIERGKWPL